MLSLAPITPSRIPCLDRVLPRRRERTTCRRTAILWACTILLVIAGCRPVPQVVNDEAVFGELDALYTAVTTKRQNLLKDCRERLTKLHDERRLSDGGFTEVSTIMEMCDDEDWADAAQRLYNFMRAQRKSEPN